MKYQTSCFFLFLKFYFRSICEKCKRAGDYRCSIRCWWTCTYLSSSRYTCSKLFWEPHKLLMPWFFFKKRKFSLMSCLKFTLSDITSLLPGSLSGLQKIIFRPAENGLNCRLFMENFQLHISRCSSDIYIFNITYNFTTHTCISWPSGIRRQFGLGTHLVTRLPATFGSKIDETQWLLLGKLVMILVMIQSWPWCSPIANKEKNESSEKYNVFY